MKVVGHTGKEDDRDNGDAWKRIEKVSKSSSNSAPAGYLSIQRSQFDFFRVDSRAELSSSAELDPSSSDSLVAESSVSSLSRLR